MPTTGILSKDWSTRGSAPLTPTVHMHPSDQELSQQIRGLDC
jgi:hypothetical protein